MASKDDILRSIRQHTPAQAERREPTGDWITYPDRAAKFAESLAFVGGKCVFVESLDQINAHFQTVPEYRAAKKVYSSLPGIGRSNVDLSAVDDPHELEDLDYAIFAGEFGVAENGAVWITERGLRHRAALFIVQHLVLVISSDEIVNNMHEAYRRLTFGENVFGAFISGPSKTADIEQSLVIGAHGPRSLIVFCDRGPFSKS